MSGVLAVLLDLGSFAVAMLMARFALRGMPRLRRSRRGIDTDS